MPSSVLGMRRSDLLLSSLFALALFGGCAGEDGKTGPAGDNGADGDPGAKGAEGADGAKGADGATGAKGADGSGPSATAVSDAVQTAFDEQLGDVVRSTVDTELGARQKGCDAVEMDPADYDGVYQVGKHLQPGEETEVCALYQTGPKDLWMNYSDVVQSAGSHHGILWLTTLTEMPLVDNLGEPVELGKIVPCDGTVVRFDGAAHPISGGQGAGNEDSPKGVMPDNVAIKVPANSFVIADLHMINVQPEPVDACMKVGLKGIPAKQVKYEAGPFFMYDIMINAPGEGTGTARQACPITHDTFLATGVSHMHARGVGYKAKWLDGDPFDAATKVKKVLYEGTEWEAPVADRYSTPLKLKAGDWIDFHCDYDNPEDRDVANNTETRDEMCMFIGVSWPYDRSQAECASPGHGINDNAGGGGYQIGNGDGTGTDFLGCFWANLTRPGATDFQSGYSGHTPEEYAATYDFQGCFVDSCEAIGPYTRPYFECVANNVGSCQEECTAAQPNFQAQCALTPEASGGCAEKYGTDGTNGTCATDSAVTTAAVGTCTTGSRADIIDGICDDLCPGCDGSDLTACDTCKGTIDYDSGNTKCLNQQTLLCVGDEVKKSATACVTDCFTGCITEEVTNCTVSDCVNGDKCAALVGSLATTSCD